jgi:hypothetical protein
MQLCAVLGSPVFFLRLSPTELHDVPATGGIHYVILDFIWPPIHHKYSDAHRPRYDWGGGLYKQSIETQPWLELTTMPHVCLAASNFKVRNHRSIYS